MRRAAVLVAVLLAVGGCTRDPTVIAPASSAASAPEPTAGSVAAPLPEGPVPPEEGALVGAWVKPDDFTQTGRVQAVQRFEGLVGRPLDIVHVFHDWDEQFPTESDRTFAESGRTLMVSWSGTDTRVIASGIHDELIRERARDLAELEQPVLLRWRWEMDRPNLRASVWSPQDYIAAWGRIRGIFTEEGVDNVGWVWCPHAQGFAEDGRDAAAFYPGDDQVDWVCADVYAGREYRTFAEAATPFLAWASQRPKPIVIGEFGVQDRGRGERDVWLREAWTAVRANPQIKAIVYFDAEREGEGGFDLRLDSSPDAVAVFRDMVLSPYFNPQGRQAR